MLKISKFSKILSCFVLFTCVLSLILSIYQHNAGWTGWCSATGGWLLVVLYESKM